MRRNKPNRKPAQPQRESSAADLTPIREKLWRELGSVTYDAITFGVPRVDVITDLLKIAENLCQVAREHNEDLSALEGLL